MIARPAPRAAGRAATPCRRQDTVPQVTLSEAHPPRGPARSRLRPGAGRRSTTPSGGGGRRCATFVLPVGHRLGLDATKYSTEFFNIGTGRATRTEAVKATLEAANYELFSVRKFADLGRTKAELESAEAGEVEQRFRPRC